jgi:uncharacterized membrane protein YedE/YeeE
MNDRLSGLIAGLVFGFGLTVSQMVNPAKVLAFLDVTGNWDPSLAFVMGGALITTLVGYRAAWRRPAPLLATHYALPSAREIDAPLVAGALLFGIGWGLVGLCPGPAISALTLGGVPILMFLASMFAGMALVDGISRWRSSRRSGALTA